MPGKRKKQLTVRFDSNVIDWLEPQSGKGYQSRMNAVLRAYMKASR
ncbi:BrnA antitoxin family protein [Chelativorans intermedius]|uniref:BrnA antitoxin family protein n=1 Tax=Chelativorans intermedius TaxID=515947 RepID=A0ABV6D888_9HYPH|nr:BrnA antitoxin family protein [Chelativorans intermedius]MCT8996860.1 BrnA antitoxin family protein [Chelativorans intermedius]